MIQTWRRLIKTHCLSIYLSIDLYIYVSMCVHVFLCAYTHVQEEEHWHFVNAWDETWKGVFRYSLSLPPSLFFNCFSLSLPPLTCLPVSFIQFPLSFSLSNLFLFLFIFVCVSPPYIQGFGKITQVRNRQMKFLLCNIELVQFCISQGLKVHNKLIPSFFWMVVKYER